MKVQYGDACLSQQQVYEWSRKFANGVTSVEDAPHPGQAQQVVTTISREGYADSLLGRKRRHFGALHA